MYYNIKLTQKKLQPSLVASYDLQLGNGTVYSGRSR